ncbi:MAG TPA: NAD(P)-dependent oxidoreductase [Polyangiaceae bacterium]|nr:NAD(P)-dependent oxidoreductase [Polyangiaceae bacterium]
MKIDESKLKVLVTGASGFLGSHVAEQLAEAGHEVLALVRKSSNRKFLATLPNVTFVYGSVEDASAVEDATRGVDAIVHAAGLVKARDAREFEKINVDGTKNLLAAAKKNAPGLKRFVFVSSLAAVGPSLDGVPVMHDCEPQPVTHYGRSKLRAEQAALAAKDELPVTVIRPPLIYGPRDNETFAFFQTVSRRVLPYLGDGKNTLSIVYVADAASACVRAIFADVPSGSLYFVEDGKVYVWRDMLAELEKVLERRALLRFPIPFFVLRGAAMASEGYGRIRGRAVMLTRDKLNELSAPHWVCDSQRTRTELGWTPQVEWTEGARRAADWYRQEGWL